MQAKWINVGSPEFKASIYDDYYTIGSFIAPKTDEGYCDILVASAILKGVSGQSTCKILTPDSKNDSFNPTQINGEEHIYNKHYLAQVKFMKDDPLKGFNVSVKVGKEILGEFFMNWAEAIYFTQEYSENK